jgi:hypothetical protein
MRVQREREGSIPAQIGLRETWYRIPDSRQASGGVRLNTVVTVGSGRLRWIPAGLRVRMRVRNQGLVDHPHQPQTSNYVVRKLVRTNPSEPERNNRFAIFSEPTDGLVPQSLSVAVRARVRDPARRGRGRRGSL